MAMEVGLTILQHQEMFKEGNVRQKEGAYILTQLLSHNSVKN